MAENERKDKFIGVSLDGRYKIIRKIGEGGMAVVYCAEDLRLSREVAVKIMRDELFHDAESRKHFRAEAQNVAMLSHPNIVSIYDVNTSQDNRDYIVMELLEGVTLRQYIDKMHPIPYKQALYFSKQIAEALSHAHSKGVIHRDIKPQNIMLMQDGTIKVADFGIAAMENELDEKSNQAVGSLNYMAPEQLRGFAATASTDIYSLGIVMYEMLTGVKPYSGRNPSEVLMKINTNEILPVRAFEQSIPEMFEKIVSKAMSPDENTRFSTASDLLNALNAFTQKVMAPRNSKNAKNSALKRSDEYDEDAPREMPAIEVSKRIKLPSKKDYLKSLTRSNRIAFSLGVFLIMAAVIASFMSLWKFWLSDVFAPANRIEMPDFVGYGYESIVTNAEISRIYNFHPEYVVDIQSAQGTVLSQEPAAGRSLMLNDNGIDVYFEVSTGYIMLDVIDVVGLDYREASLKLQNAGFTVEINNITSSTVEKDLVVSTSPSAGEQLTSGSTVYVNVSAGNQLNYVQVPNVVGLSEDAAIAKIKSAGLDVSEILRQQSDYDAGTVIAQSLVAFAEAQEHSLMSLTVSAGPWG